MVKKVKKLARTRPQYDSFRRAFKKWSDAKRKLDDWTDAKVTNGSLKLVRSGATIYEYIAPDYCKYMAYAWRKYIS